MSDLAQQNALRLRRRLHLQTDPAASSDLLDQLRVAEQAVAAAVRAPVPDPAATILSAGTAAPTHQLSADTTGLVAEVTLRMSQVPGSIIHLLDAKRYPLITVSVRNGKTDHVRRVRVTSFVEGYSARAVDSVELPVAAPAHVFAQLPTFFPERISTLRELTRASLHVLVEDLDGAVELENTTPIWISPPSTALLRVPDPTTGGFVDFTPYLAAFVTPDDEEVLRWLRVAAKAHVAGRLVGYQGDPAAGVANQVSAIYTALKQEAKITYINTVVAFGVEQGTAIQRIRLPRESLRQQSANCIDGTVLFASLLEAATLNPAIVIVPGHAFLGWETWQGSKSWNYLETTMIGTHDFAKACSSADALVQQYQAIAPSPMTVLPVPDLRANGIFPMS